MSTAAPAEVREQRPKPSRRQIIGAIIGKDLVEFRRNRFIMLITILVIVAWAVIYQFLPKTVDETVELGVVIGSEALDANQLDPATAADLASALSGSSDQQAGVSIRPYATADQLRAAVADGEDVTAGLVLSESFAADVAAGRQATITLVVPAGLPEQVETLLRSAADELGFLLSGNPAPADLAGETEVVGTDRVGDQVPFAEQIRPLLLIAVLATEVFALASLVAGEVAERTATAVLVTPASAGNLVTAKALLGTALAFTEVVVLAILIGALASGAGLVLLSLLLGAFLVTGLGLLIGSLGRDFMDTLILGMLVLVPMLIPGIAALFPGSAPAWVQILPTYGVAEVLIQGSAGTISFSEALLPLAISALWSVLLLLLGAATLNRRVARL